MTNFGKHSQNMSDFVTVTKTATVSVSRLADAFSGLSATLATLYPEGTWPPNMMNKTFTRKAGLITDLQRANISYTPKK
jgi:hypothetical protein